MPAATAAIARSTGPVAAFVRFVVCGGGVTLLASAVLLLVGDRVPLAAANAVVTVASTVLATELHGRFTFGRGGAGWRDHCASGFTVLLSYLFTTGALLGFAALHPEAGPLARQGVYLAASALAGLGRFLLLRLVVFAAACPAAPCPAAVRPSAVRPATPAKAVPRLARPAVVAAA
jgi:putative flippase GtrA